jgi:hypothetical protein
MFEDDFDDREQRKKYTIANIKMTLTRDQIMTFVGGLHETQMELIEAMVSSRERQGFPEATTVIKHIMELK